MSYPEVIDWMFPLPNTSCLPLTLPGITRRRIAKVLCRGEDTALGIGKYGQDVAVAQRDTCSVSKVVERNIEIHFKLALK